VIRTRASFKPLPHTLAETHVRTNNREIVHPHAGKTPDQPNQPVRSGPYERHASPVAIGEAMLRQNKSAKRNPSPKLVSSRSRTEPGFIIDDM